MEESKQQIRAKHLADNLIAQVNRVFRSSNSKSIETRYTYWATAKRFVSHVAEVWGVQNIRNLREEHVQSYINRLLDDDRLSTYIKTEMSGIRHLFHIADCRHSLPADNAAFGIPRREADIKPGASEEEYLAIRNIALASGKQEQVISIDFMRHLSMRLNESQCVQVRRIKDAIETGILHLDKHDGTKGGRPRDIPIQTAEQREVLKEAMQYARDKGKTLGDRLTTGRERGAVHKSKAAIERLFVKNKDKTGDITPHSLRRAFAQGVYDRTVGSDKERMRAVHAQLGHGSDRPDITARYVFDRHAK